MLTAIDPPRLVAVALVALVTGCASGGAPPPAGAESAGPKSPANQESGYSVNVALFAPGLTISDKECTLSDGTVTTCIEVKTPAIRAPNGPYCRDGYAYGDAVSFEPSAIGSCKEFSHEADVLCVECQPEAATQTWLIPKVPVPQPVAVEGDRGWDLAGGYGLALDGVPVSHAPPPKRSPLPAVDACGGHSGPDSDYHYHYIPTGPDSAQPDGAASGGKAKDTKCLVDDHAGHGHSPLFAYAMDGYPMYGRFGKDGTTPKDLDACGGHVATTAEWPEGVYHYHAKGAVDADHGSGPTYLPFIQCFKGAIGSSDNPQRRGSDGGGHPPGGGPPGGGPPGGGPPGGGPPGGGPPPGDPPPDG